MLALLALVGVASGAERRVALVVGNSSYPDAPLANPKNDAADIADTLTQLGFDVIRHIDAGRNDINDALEEFQRKASGADAALFYYAGHAMQYNDQNYLLPVDAVLRDQYSVPQLTSLSRVRDALSTCGECVKIMILDACRNNPLADRFIKDQFAKSRSLSSPARGLARLSEKPDGMIVVFATQAGDVAADGQGRNSPFTQALLAELKKPELGLGELFNDVALDVKTSTGKTQVPEISYSAVRTLNEFYLNQSEGDTSAFEKLDFSDIQALRRFVQDFPQSSKRRVVENLVAEMERQARERAKEARQAEAEAQRTLDADRTRVAAEADAKRQAEAQRAEADRVRLAAEADAKRQAEAQRAEADRVKREADAEAQRTLDADRARLAAEADAKRQAETDQVKRDAEVAPRVEAQLNAPVESRGTAPAAEAQPQGTATADHQSLSGVVEEARRGDARQTSLETRCKSEHARFVALKQRGRSAFKALTAMKAHLVCAETANEVEAALKAPSVRGEQRRPTAFRGNPGAVAPPQRSFPKASVARLRPGLEPATVGRFDLESGIRQAQRNNRERSRLDDMESSFRFAPAPAVSTSEAPVDFHGAGF